MSSLFGRIWSLRFYTKSTLFILELYTNMASRLDNFKWKQNTNWFRENPQNISPNKPRKTLSVVNWLLKSEWYEPCTYKDIQSIYLFLLNLPLEKIVELWQDKEQPAIVRFIIKAITQKDWLRSFDIIERMLDRSVGKSVETINQTTKVEKVQIEILQPDSNNFSAPTSIQQDIKDDNEHNEN